MNTAIFVLTSTELESAWRHEVSQLWIPPVLPSETAPTPGPASCKRAAGGAH